MNEALKAAPGRAGRAGRGRAHGYVTLGMSASLSGLRVFISEFRESGRLELWVPLGPSSFNLWGVAYLPPRPPSPGGLSYLCCPGRARLSVPAAWRE